MEKQPIGRKKRKDAGKHHRAYTHEGKRVGQYDLAGRLEREYDSLQDAVASNEVGAIYQGILFCCQGRIRKHCNKIWRWEETKSEETNLDDLI